ncbi:MAG: synthase subunit delta [Bacteroidota bacterium]|jgi:F-type H+-transporting ATPase subunit delta
MSDLRVASRYAKSVIDLTLERGNLDKVHADFLCFLNTVNDSNELSLLLQSPIVKGDKKINVLKAIFASTFDNLTIEFLSIVTRKGREALLLSIAKAFIAQYNTIKGIIEVEITSAAPLSSESRASFVSAVSASTGKTVTLIEKVKPSLIGGYILKLDDKQIDESIQSKLSGIQLKFSSNPYISKL